MRITLSVSNVTQQGKNTYYGKRVEVNNIQDLTNAARWDFVPAKLKNNQRSNSNFLCADCIGLDIDNSQTEDPNKWIYPEDVEEAFTEVAFYVHYSRNNNIEKKGKAPRPKFHLLFPIDECTDAGEYEMLLKEAANVIPSQADPGAMKISQCFFGTKDPVCEYHDGKRNLSAFLRERRGETEGTSAEEYNDDRNTYGSERGNTIWSGDIEEGIRNSTMSRIALSLLKRYGDEDNTAYDEYFKQSERCDPALPDEELNTIWKSAERKYRDTIKNSPGYKSPDEYTLSTLISAFGDIDSDDKEIEEARSFLERVNMDKNTRYSRNDIGAGYLLADYMKPFARPLSGTNKWIVYDGKRWTEKNGSEIVAEAAKSMALAIARYLSAFIPPDAKRNDDRIAYLSSWLTENKRRDYIKSASSVYPVSYEDFDKDPLTINLLNGTLDLRTERMHKHNPEDLLMKLAPVEYRPELGKCERWERFIKQIMEPCSPLEWRRGGDEEGQTNGITEEEKEIIRNQKADFLQRYAGYCLTGETKEESFLILYGPTTRNGKSVFVRAISAVLGDYAVSIHSSTLLKRYKNKRDGSAATPDLVTLKGARLASVGEMPQDGSLSAEDIKDFTGNDPVTARPLYSDPIHFFPQFKLLMHTNYLPACSDLTLFKSNRVLVMPFTKHFRKEEQDKSLKQEFSKPEILSCILNWMLEGWREYKKNGLNPPSVVESFTDDYHHENDRVRRFKEECLVEDPNGKARIPTSKLYKVYDSWCRDNGGHPEGKAKFRKNLEATGVFFTKGKTESGSCTTIVRGYSFTEEYQSIGEYPA